jgi:hypothetical protein
MVVTTKYLGGGIIEGASTDSTSSNATLTYTGDMSSGWTQTDSGADFTIDTTNEEVDLLGAYNANNVRWDSSTVATLSTTAWVVRFAYQNTGTASGDNPVWWVGFSTDSTVASNSTAQDFVGFGSQVGNGGTTLRTYLYATDNARLDQATSAQRLQLDSSNVDLVSDNTKYYIEIKRDGNDFTVNAYSDSAYSTLLCAKTYTYSAVGTLRYFIIANYIQGSNVTGTFSEFNWWNGVTAPVTVTPKDKSTITNIPTGTRYHETDTRKIFRRKDEGYGSPAVGSSADITTNSAGTLSQATGSGTIFTSGSELQTGCFDFGSTRVRTGNLQLIPRTNFTVAFWTKADSFSTAGSNSPRYIHGDGNSMIIELGNNANPQIVNFQVATASGANAKEVAHGMSTGTWYHLAFVYDSSNGDMIIYRDGTAIATDTANSYSLPVQAHTSWWEFGGGSNEYMDGQMNDFAIWNTDLSSSNISTLVGNKTSTVKRATSVLKTNIVAYWDGSDAIVTVPNLAKPSAWVEKGTA